MTAPALSLMNVKALALGVTDLERAIRFYTDTLSLRPAFEEGKQVGNHLGHTVLLFKSGPETPPSTTLNPRVTILTDDAHSTEATLRKRGVEIADPVARYGEALVGSFLDSEGNKLWFCSDPGSN
jgi:catechol 2,3-dioxygenase-like lactoylglutathione lyase family enzyme